LLYFFLDYLLPSPFSSVVPLFVCFSFLPPPFILTSKLQTGRDVLVCDQLCASSSSDAVPYYLLPWFSWALCRRWKYTLRWRMWDSEPVSSIDVQSSQQSDKRSNRISWNYITKAKSFICVSTYV
jgi:hypothetical protein